ncbi:hypothetical protein D2T29_10080 [Sinirhodobacter populi]|uniref:Uncharacterized protein n=1 Tax=Paenirhodobacter populi TaxID=2306993 RepID=A0A443KEZ0_9RHOB|nr:hypothetical protein [Sinirhodobacter populi]RWR31384.1 hypothetical protein D2T29_10080 [Sinirhodobacter populi]
MIRLLVIGTVVALLAAGVQSWRVTRLSEQLTAAQSQLGAYAEAAAIRARQDAEQARLRDAAVALDEDLSHMEGGDAPLDTYLSDAARKLWP